MLKAAIPHTLTINDPLRPTRPLAILSHSSPTRSVGGSKPCGTFAHDATSLPPLWTPRPFAPFTCCNLFPMGRKTTLHLLGIRCVRGQSVESYELSELSAQLCEEELDEADEELEDDVEEPKEAKRNKEANTVPIAGTTMEFPHPWKMRPRD